MTVDLVSAALAAPSATSPPVPATTASPRVALALGLAGALGEELLARLVGSNAYRQVVVGVTQPLGSATARFSPWVYGQGLPVVDEAWIGLTGDETFVPSASPIVRIGTEGLLEAARTAQACGARRLVVVSPLAALLQMNAGTQAAGSADEIALVQMNFEQLVIVRPTAAEVEADDSLPQRLVRSAARALAGIMLPAYTQTLSAPLAARAIVEAVAQAPGGLSVLGARELVARIEADGGAPKRPRLGAFADRRISR
jgi:hypothetical protein